jgi:hypothetical protein
MNNEQQLLLIDEAYENYCKEYSSLYYLEDKIEYGSSDYHHDIEDYSFEAYTQEEFIHRCKKDSEFSEKWGLTIEERELSLEERETLLLEIDDTFRTSTTQEIKLVLDEYNIPTKLITITYQDQKTESYE